MSLLQTGTNDPHTGVRIGEAEVPGPGNTCTNDSSVPNAAAPTDPNIVIDGHEDAHMFSFVSRNIRSLRSNLTAALVGKEDIIFLRSIKKG